ncbi:MAG: lipopolysaccharide biosynthesis protein [Steroidobacteraceae bacterium]
MTGVLYSHAKARRSLIDTIAFRALSQISTVVGYVILVRAMTEQDFGVFSLFYAFIPVIGTVASLGLEQVLRRYQPEYLRAGNQLAAAWLVRLIASWRFVTSVLVLGGVLLGWNYVAPLFKLAGHREIFSVFGVLIVLHFQSSILQLALGAHMLHRYSVGSTVVLSLVKLFAYSVLFWFGKLDLIAAIVVDILAYGVAYISMRLAYQKICLGAETSGRYRPDSEERRRLIRYGLFNNFNDAGVLLMYSTLDSFFIAAFVDTVSVGVYAFYTRLRQMVAGALPMKLFENVIQPMFFSIPSAEAERKVPQYFSFLLNMDLILQWPALAFAIAYHAEIVQVIFGGKFIEYSWLLPMVFGFATVNAVADPATLVAQYEEKAGVILTSKLFAIYNIAAMAAMVPLMGVYGAVIASGTAQLMKNGFIWWHVRRRAVWINARDALVFAFLVWGAAVALCLGMKRLLPAPAPMQLAIGIVVFAAAGWIYLRSPALSPADRAILAAVMGDRHAKMLQRIGLLSSAAATRIGA